MEQNLFEKLVQLSPGMEIWWDSSPVIFENWCNRLLQKATPEERDHLQAQFNRMSNPSQPEDQLFQGVTTNPSLSLQAVQDDTPFWTDYTKRLIKENSGMNEEQIFWLLYKLVVKRGSEMYLPLFELSGYRTGYLSGQVDPRYAFDKEKMLQQAQELAAINPNVMIKIPGTKEGYEVIETLTAMGISTNNTATFVLSQLLDCALSVKKGLETARRNCVDLSKWRSVITMMESRFADLGGLREDALSQGIELDDSEVRLAELAIFKKAYRFLKDNRLPSKMLSCSLRLGPVVDGVNRVWHLEEKTGADIVVTCPPTFIEEVLLMPDRDKIVLEENRIDREIPKTVLEKLLRIPYFERSFEQDGYSRDEYATLRAMKKTLSGFSKDTEEMVAFVRSCFSNRNVA